MFVEDLWLIKLSVKNFYFFDVIEVLVGNEKNVFVFYNCKLKLYVFVMFFFYWLNDIRIVGEKIMLKLLEWLKFFRNCLLFCVKFI